MPIRETIESMIHTAEDWHSRKFTLLHYAVLLRSPLAVGALLNAGFLPESDEKGITPLHLAAAVGDTEICKKLTIAYPNERLVCTPCGLNPADMAQIFGHPSLVGILGQPNQALGMEGFKPADELPAAPRPNPRP